MTQCRVLYAPLSAASAKMVVRVVHSSVPRACINALHAIIAASMYTPMCDFVGLASEQESVLISDMLRQVRPASCLMDCALFCLLVSWAVFCPWKGYKGEAPASIASANVTSYLKHSTRVANLDIDNLPCICMQEQDSGIQGKTAFSQI